MHASNIGFAGARFVIGSFGPGEPGLGEPRASAPGFFSTFSRGGGAVSIWVAASSCGRKSNETTRSKHPDVRIMAGGSRGQGRAYLKAYWRTEQCERGERGFSHSHPR